MIYANDNFFLAIGIPNEPPPRILIEPTYFPEIVRSSVGRGYNGRKCLAFVYVHVVPYMHLDHKPGIVTGM